MKIVNRSVLHHVFTAALAAAFAMLLTMGFSMGSAYAADEDQYIFGTARECSTFTAGEYLEDSFYYSDGWFAKDPEVQNDALALLSMQLSAAATDDQENGNGAALLKQMGFENIGFAGFKSDDPEDMAYTYAFRTTGEGEDQCTIIAVAVQSYAFDKDTKIKGWTQNFTVNGSGESGAKGEHYALGKAADKALDDIAALSAGKTGKVKYWIMGHSRGGALANLIAAKLPGKLGAGNAAIYAYTFESPATVDPEGQDVKTGYGYIHNYFCDDDLVPMVPPWDMTRYGQAHQLNTEAADAGMAAELKKIGSKMNAPEASGEGGGENKTAEIIEKLVSVIPDRKAYSSENKDTFISLDGQEVTIEYSYQGMFTKLMGIVFGDGIELPGIGDHLNEVLASLDPYIRAYMTEQGKYEVEGETNAYYYKAAVDLHEKLDSLDGEADNFPLKAEEVYVILKLAAPLAIDAETADMGPSYAITEGPMTSDLVMAYLMPAISTFTNTAPVTFSHQFDTAIARLKALAPAPELEEIEIQIPAPKAGDSRSKASRDAKKYLEDKGLTWLDVTARWDTDDLYLKNNRKYYLNLTLYAAGHTASEAPQVSIVNEKEEHAPQANAPEVSSKEGLTIVKTAFAYEFGEPAQYKVSFESDYGEVPEEMTVPAGTILKYEEKPEAGTREGYEFGDWYCGDDVWDEIVVLNDKALTAGWVELIKAVEVSFDQPRAGQKLGSLRTPVKASYHVEWARLEDEDSNEVETAKKNQQLSLRYRIVPNSKSARFAEEDGEFTGSVMVNGKTAEFDYDSEDGIINVTAEFKVKGQSNPLAVKGKTASVKYSKLKKKAQKLVVSKVIKFTKNAKDKKTYTLSSAKKGSKSFKKYFKISKTTGKVIVKKRLKKGTYKVTVKVRAAGNSTYEPSAVKTVTFKVRVR